MDEQAFSYQGTYYSQGDFIAIRQFAKRQMSWFRRWENQGMKIHWIKNQKEAENLINEEG